MIKAVGYVFVFIGIFLMLGSAGADCDGKCMENAMTLSEIVMYALGGMAIAICGGLMVAKG